MIDVTKLRVLVVDDQDSMRGLLVVALKGNGVTAIHQANSVAQAKGALGAARFDLVLCDYNMDDGTGVDVLKYVRAHPVLKDLKFIMVTGNADTEVVRDAVQHGVDGYVTKPVAPADLLARIKHVYRPRSG